MSDETLLRSVRNGAIEPVLSSPMDGCFDLVVKKDGSSIGKTFGCKNGTLLDLRFTQESSKLSLER